MTVLSGASGIASKVVRRPPSTASILTGELDVDLAVEVEDDVRQLVREERR